MRRMHLIELHEQSWFPGSQRDVLTDELQLLLSLTKPYQPLIRRLRGALERSGSTQIVDLCSGAGGPWLGLYPQLERAGSPPFDLVLTDKYPNAGASRAEKTAAGSRMRFSQEPVDATRLPDSLRGFRTLFNSFHHFRPREARAILQDAFEKKQGIGIFETPGRHALTILMVFLVPVGALLVAPFVRPFRWTVLLWTYLIPVVPAVLFFDGMVSCLRAYSPKELGELAEPLRANGYQWEIGEERGGWLRLPITYLIGYPDRMTEEPNLR
jgi:hypothetical protein